MINVFHTAVATITGAVRDSYMLLTQGKSPTLPTWLNDENHKEMKQIVLESPGIKKFIENENANILNALNDNNTTHLLDVFSAEDIRVIKEQVKSI